jgi:hypothetical protein
MLVGVRAAEYRQTRSDGLRNCDRDFRRRWNTKVVADDVTGSSVHDNPTIPPVTKSGSAKRSTPYRRSREHGALRPGWAATLNRELS